MPAFSLAQAKISTAMSGAPRRISEGMGGVLRADGSVSVSFAAETAQPTKLVAYTEVVGASI
jgi:hypothetical protein